MLCSGGGQGGGCPGQKGAGGVWDVGEEGARGGEIGGNYATLHTISQSKRWESANMGQEPGTPPPPPPIYSDGKCSFM